MPEADAARRTASDDPGTPRRAALERLAALLRHQGFTVRTAHWHLTATANGGSPMEVWCHARPEDGGRLWFLHAGGLPIALAVHPATAAREVHRTFFP